MPPTTTDFLDAVGVRRIPPSTSPFDPGYDPSTLASHLRQSAHLISVLKISMACWLVADETASREKFAAARAAGVKTTTGGGPFEVAVAQRQLEMYLELCADVGADRIECGSGFTDVQLDPVKIVERAAKVGLEVQFELGEKHGGAFDGATVDRLLEEGRRWLDAGATQLVVEARESADAIGVFGTAAELNAAAAEAFVDAFGFEVVCFEAPTKASQFAMLDHFGHQVQLCNVRLEEILRVEIYRRGLHSDAFRSEALRPRRPPDDGDG